MVVLKPVIGKNFNIAAYPTDVTPVITNFTMLLGQIKTKTRLMNVFRSLLPIVDPQRLKSQHRDRMCMLNFTMATVLDLNYPGRLLL